MALAAARTRKAGDQDVTLAAVPDPPTLQERLAVAQQAAVAPARRVAELDQAMRDALTRQDYATAGRVKDELAEARMEHGIAAAAVQGLQSAIVETERLRAEDHRVIQEQQQKAEARERYDVALQREQEGLSQLDAKVAAVLDGLEVVKRDYQHAVQLQHQVGRARAEMTQARVVLGEVPAGLQFVSPNKADVLADELPVIRELVKWSR